MKAYQSTILGVSLVAAILGSSVPSRAEPPQPAAPATDADTQAARWLAVGNKAFKTGKLVQAEEAYRAAWTIKRGFDIAGDLGMAELALGNAREAAEHLAFSLRMFPITGDPAARQQIQKAYDRCVQDLSAVRLAVPVKGAPIYVDGALRGEAPLEDPIFLDPGEHVFEARMPGYTGAPQRIVTEKGGERELTLPMEAVPEVQKPAPRPTPVVLPPPQRRRSVVPIAVLGGLAVAGVGSGLVLFGVSAGAESEGQALRAQLLKDGKGCAARPDPRCASLRSDFQRSDTLHNTAIGTTLVGVASAAGAATYLFWPMKAPSTRLGLRAIPVVGAGTGGLTVTGSFD